MPRLLKSVSGLSKRTVTGSRKRKIADRSEVSADVRPTSCPVEESVIVVVPVSENYMIVSAPIRTQKNKIGTRHSPAITIIY